MFQAHLAIVFFLSSCYLVASQSDQSIIFTEKVDSLGDVVTDIQSTPGDDRLFVVLRNGLIKIVSNATGSNPSVSGTFLDISDRVRSSGEQGLLGLAFHPNYETNGFFFVNYIDETERNTRISRFTAASSNTVDPSTELIMAEIAQPQGNHNGGQIHFGHNDNYLYIATGDGGGGGDPEENGQDLTSYLGKLLRVDVDNVNESASVSVGNPRWQIPPDNSNCEMVDPNALGEIVAYGLRNPWRVGFDRLTGDFWVADVGQVQREEINVIPSSQFLTKCHDFGWNVCEGTIEFDPPLPPGCSSCSDATCFVVPVVQHGRNAAQSVTGGFVYRGTEFAEVLDGMYIYADYVTGNLWGVKWDGNSVSSEVERMDVISGPTTFGEDVNGELFVGTAGGALYRVEYGTVVPSTCPFVLKLLKWIAFLLRVITFGLIDIEVC